MSSSLLLCAMQSVHSCPSRVPLSLQARLEIEHLLLLFTSLCTSVSHSFFSRWGLCGCELNWCWNYILPATCMLQPVQSCSCLWECEEVSRLHDFIWVWGMFWVWIHHSMGFYLLEYWRSTAGLSVIGVHMLFVYTYSDAVMHFEYINAVTICRKTNIDYHSTAGEDYIRITKGIAHLQRDPCDCLYRSQNAAYTCNTTKKRWIAASWDYGITESMKAWNIVTTCRTVQYIFYIILLTQYKFDQTTGLDVNGRLTGQLLLSCCYSLLSSHMLNVAPLLS